MDKDESLTEKIIGFLLAQIVSVSYMARVMDSQEDVADFAKIATVSSISIAELILEEKKVKEIVRNTAQVCEKHVKELNENATKGSN